MPEDSESLVPEDASKRKEIWTYKAPWQVQSMGLCQQADQRFKIAIASYKEDYVNTVQLVQLKHGNSHQDWRKSFRVTSEFEHPYPPTKLMWGPPSGTAASLAGAGSGSNNSLIATTGDFLRIWSVNGETDQVSLKSVMNGNKNAQHCAPISSFDWNVADPNILGTSCMDMTVTIWDLNTCQSKIQLIAHDKEVFDIQFAVGKNIFSTVGGDGSLRLFDLRSLDHSTILYETPDQSSLIRLAWNKLDPNYILTTGALSNNIVIVDMRMPSVPCKELVSHRGCVNGATWAPHSANHICSVGEDGDALIWDISTSGGGVGANNSDSIVSEPALAYSLGPEKPINNVQWCGSHEAYIAIAFDRYLQFLKV